MKKQYVSLLVILLAASGFLFSCGNTVNKSAGALEFDSIQVNEVAHLFGDTAKPGCNIIINFAYANKSSDEKLKDSLNTYFLSACFGDKYMTLKPEEAVKLYKETYIKDYLKDLEPMYAKDEAEKEDSASILAWYSYYKGIESHVQYYKKHLLRSELHPALFRGLPAKAFHCLSHMNYCADPTETENENPKRPFHFPVRRTLYEIDLNPGSRSAADIQSLQRSTLLYLSYSILLAILFQTKHFYYTKK